MSLVPELETSFERIKLYAQPNFIYVSLEMATVRAGLPRRHDIRRRIFQEFGLLGSAKSNVAASRVTI
jgi:hypothetical protein